MQIPLTSAAAILPVAPLQIAPAGPKTADFASVLKSAVTQVENSSATAATAAQSFISGDGGELHSTVLATQRASLELDMFLQMRNKVVQAYQEVMRMQL